MPKRRKPWPPFIVHVLTGKFYLKTAPDYASFQDRLRHIVYTCDRNTATFNRMSTFEQQVNPKSFRRPTYTELLLFDKT